MKQNNKKGIVLSTISLILFLVHYISYFFVIFDFGIAALLYLIPFLSIVLAIYSNSIYKNKYSLLVVVSEIVIFVLGIIIFCYLLFR